MSQDAPERAGRLLQRLVPLLRVHIAASVLPELRLIARDARAIGTLLHMRPELRRQDYHIYGLSEYDYDYFFDLVKRVAASHIERTQNHTAPFRNDPVMAEAASDAAYYAHVDSVFLWEYALWRLQGIFEGLIMTLFLPHLREKRLMGLLAKLKAMQNAGYTLTAEDEQELTEWAELRNALSHRPPEQYRPSELRETDVQEYLAIVKRHCARWRSEMQGVIVRLF